MSMEGTPRWTKGHVVVGNIHYLCLKKYFFVAELFGGLPDEGYQPISGFGFAENVEILVADHVGQDEGFDFGQGSVARAHLAARWRVPVKRVGVRPGGFNRFFTIVEDQPDRVAFELLAARGPAARNWSAIGQQQAGGVGTHPPSLAPADELMFVRSQ